MNTKLELDNIEGIDLQDLKRIKDETGFVLPPNLKLFLEL